MLIGQCDFLTETVMAFCRLDEAIFQEDLTEVEVPTRFAFLVLGPTGSTSIWEFTEMGRAMAALLSDKVDRPRTPHLCTWLGHVTRSDYCATVDIPCRVNLMRYESYIAG